MALASDTEQQNTINPDMNDPVVRYLLGFIKDINQRKTVVEVGIKQIDDKLKEITEQKEAEKAAKQHEVGEDNALSRAAAGESTDTNGQLHGTLTEDLAFLEANMKPGQKLRSKKLYSAENIIERTGASSSELRSLEKEYGSDVYKDTDSLENKIYKVQRKEAMERIRAKRMAMLRNGLHESFSIDQHELAKISNDNLEALRKSIGHGERLKLRSNRSAVKTVSPLFKSVVNVIFDFRVNVRVVEDVDGKKKKKKELFSLKDALELTFKNTIGKLINRITTTVKTTTRAIKTSMASSKLGRTITNANTALSKVGKVFAAGAEVYRTTGCVVKGFARGVLPAAAIYVATGGAVAPAVVALVASGATHSLQNILKARPVKYLKLVKDFQEKYGSGQFYDRTGKLELCTSKETAIPRIEELRATGVMNAKEMAEVERLEKEVSLIDKGELRGKNIFSKLERGLRVFNATTDFATLGYVIGSLLGSGLTGAIIGGVVGGGGTLLWDTIKGKTMFKVLSENSKFLRILSKVPLMELVGQIGTNLWVASQIQIIMSSYKGDFGRYFKENFLFGDQNVPFWQNIFVSASNIIQVGAGIAGTMSFVGGLSTLASYINPSVAALTGPEALAVGGAMALGVGTSLGVLSALGVTIGPVAVISATVAAAAASLLIMVLLPEVGIPVLLAAIFGGSFVAGGIGGYVGSFADKALNKLLGGFMSALNSISVYFQLFTFLTRALDSDSLIMIAIAFANLLIALDKAQEIARQDSLLKSNSSESSSSISPSVENFSYYNVHLINNGTLTPQARENLLAFLEDSADELHLRFPGKEIYLTTATDANFEGDTIVLLSINAEDLQSGDLTALTKEVDSQIPQLAVNSQFLTE